MTQTRFRLLGPLEAAAGADVLSLGGVKQRALLAVLLLHPNEFVSREQLIDDLWGGRAPPGASHNLDSYISRLRKALRENGARESPLLTRPGGYLLRLEPDQLDVATFEHLLAEGQQALAAGEAALAAAALEEALSLWRGEPLADLALEPFARIAVERLAELRLRAVEAQIEAGLALGRHATLVPELEALVAREPLREGLRRQLVLALYRCDRQAAALEVYRTTQRLLKDELGLAPSHELARLERLILTHDPELDLVPLETSSSTSSPTPVRARRALYQTNLPVPATPFLGRESDLTHLHRLLSDDNVRLLTLTGPGGSGKTRLALRSARAAIPGFPGGAWWVSLAALRDPTLVLEVAARALGSASDLVDHIDGKHLLLILDNFEHLIPAADPTSHTCWKDARE